MSTSPSPPACAACLPTFNLIGLLAQAAKTAGSHTENPGVERDGKDTIGPEYKVNPDLTDRGHPKGKYFECKLRVADRKIFRGDDSTLEPEKKPLRIFTHVSENDRRAKDAEEGHHSWVMAGERTASKKQSPIA